MSKSYRQLYSNPCCIFIQKSIRVMSLCVCVCFNVYITESVLPYVYRLESFPSTLHSHMLCMSLHSVYSRDHKSRQL